MNRRAAGLALIVILVAVPAHASRLYGPVRDVPPPDGAVFLSPGDNLQAAVDDRPAGTVFYLRKGLYRQQSIQPKDGDQFIGAYGATLTGAKLLTEFERANGLYVARNQHTDPATIVHGECRPEYPRCDHPQDLYFDGRPLRAVAALAGVRPGTFFFDYPSHAVYFADNPHNHVVELSHRAFAFGGAAARVLVQNLIVEKYAAADQRAAIDNSAGKNWRIVNNDVRWNHGMGIIDGPGDTVTGNAIHHNGELGIGGGSGMAGVRIENNEIAYNVWNGTNCTWECGGAKWGNVNNLTVTGNYVHHNDGDGLWTDIDCTAILYDGNIIEHNLYAGISHEISGAAIIRNNVLRFNGAHTFNWGWQGQIQIQNSTDTEVYGNTIVLSPNRGGNGIMIVQQNRGATHMPHDNYIHDNDITMAGGDGAVSGWFADFHPNDFRHANNRFDHNHYHVLPRGPGARVWAVNDWVGFAAWQASGQDRHSTRDGDVSAIVRNGGVP